MTSEVEFGARGSAELHGVAMEVSVDIDDPAEEKKLMDSDQQDLEHFEKTYSSHFTLRKEYRDLQAMVQKSLLLERQATEGNLQQAKKQRYSGVGVFSAAFFAWIFPIVRKLMKGTLAVDALELSDAEKADTSYKRFRAEWNKELANGNSDPSLFRALRRSFLHVFVTAFILKLLWGLTLVIAVAVLVRYLVRFVAVPSTPTWQGYVLAGSFLVACLLMGFLLHHMTSWSVRLGIGVRSSLIRAIFDKSMTAKNTSQSVGEVLSLISRDCFILFQAAKSIQYLWSGPFEVAMLIIALLIYIGWPALWVFVLCVLVVPLQYWFGTQVTKIREKNVLSNTERLLIMHEILYSIKLVKFYTWEKSFSDKIKNIRAEELAQLRKAAWIKSFNLALVFLFPPLAAVGAFVCMIIDDQQLKPVVTFTVLTICNSLRFPLVMFPTAIKNTADAIASLERIRKFLTSEDMSTHPEAEKTGIFMNNVTFGYPIEDHAGASKSNEEADDADKEKDKVEVVVSENNAANNVSKPAGPVESSPAFAECLRDVSMDLVSGDCLAIIGQTGSGKSTLFNGILNECDVIRGSVSIKGRIAYVPQNPFIMHGTVRDNILFGLPYEEDWYRRVLYACCLPSDLATFSHSDLTYLSEGGINLSGGQRQRIALARAVYSKADIYLLDSVLSALDPATGRKCFRRCVKKLMRNSIVLLVTHSLDSLPQCNKLMVLEDGKVRHIGGFSADAVTAVFPNNNLSNIDNNAQPGSHDAVNVIAKDTFTSLARNETAEYDPPVEDPDSDGKVEAFSPEPKSSHAGFAWIRACGSTAFWLTVALFVSTQIVRIFSDYWVRFWTRDTLNKSDTFYVAIYAIIIAVFGIMLMTRGVIFYLLSFRAAQRFQAAMYKAIVEAPMLFFTNEPLGKILKSFSQDQDTVDDSLPDIAHITLIFVSICVTTMVIVCVVIPWNAFFLVLVLGGWLLLQRFIADASHRLKSAASETNSSTIVHASESMHGVPVVRAFGMQDFVRAENESLVDANNSAVFHLEHIELWTELMVDILATVFVTATALFIVTDRNGIAASDAGLAISNATQLLVFLAMMVQGFGDVFYQLYAVSRIDDYIKKTPSEDFSSSLELPKEGGKPVFPRGEISVENIDVAYDPMKGLVLNNVSVQIKAGERIGIVGRTGSGKTSLLNSVFRLMETQRGTIVIDGYDVKKLHIRELREALCIIPQEPVLFKGTYRSNLDPFNDYTDEELWNALELSHMKDFVAAQSDGLATEIVEGGQNISIGQKQLLCLTRVILKKNCRILVLDEATSALDPLTDQLIQEAIRNVFKTQTILAIAHRLDTIKDYDKIMVLHFGELKEFDTPENLLAIEGGYFKSMHDSHQE